MAKASPLNETFAGSSGVGARGASSRSFRALKAVRITSLYLRKALFGKPFKGSGFIFKGVSSEARRASAHTKNLNDINTEI